MLNLVFESPVLRFQHVGLFRRFLADNLHGLSQFLPHGDFGVFSELGELPQALFEGFDFLIVAVVAIDGDIVVAIHPGSHVEVANVQLVSSEKLFLAELRFEVFEHVFLGSDSRFDILLRSSFLGVVGHDEIDPAIVIDGGDGHVCFVGLDGVVNRVVVILAAEVAHIVEEASLVL